MLSQTYKPTMRNSLVSFNLQNAKNDVSPSGPVTLW
jgi:hypothetical protein